MKEKLTAAGQFIKKHKIMLVIIVLVLVAGGAWTWYALTHTEAETTYKTATVSKGTVATTVSATGSLAAATSSSITPSISGTVEDVSVQVGDTVTAGQTLFTIKNNSLGIALSKAAITIKEAQQKINEDLNAITQAQENLATVNADEKATDSQKAAAALKVSAAQLKLSSDKISLAEAQQSYTEAAESADERTVTAPIAGTITTLSVSDGDTLGGSGASSGGSGGASSSSSSSSASVVVTDMSVLQVEVTLNEADAVNVKAGQTVSLTFDAIDDLTLTGKVKSIDAVGTSSSNVVSYPAVISLDTADSRLKPGMSVSATITTDMKQDVINISNSAIKTTGDTSYVLLMNTDGTTSQQTIETGLVGDSVTEVTSGLTVGKMIVTQTITASTTAATTSTTTTSRNALSGFTGGGGGSSAMSGGGGTPPSGMMGGGAQ